MGLFIKYRVRSGVTIVDIEVLISGGTGGRIFSTTRPWGSVIILTPSAQGGGSYFLPMPIHADIASKLSILAGLRCIFIGIAPCRYRVEFSRFWQGFGDMFIWIDTASNSVYIDRGLGYVHRDRSIRAEFRSISSISTGFRGIWSMPISTGQRINCRNLQ